MIPPHPSLAPEELEQLAELFTRTAQAMTDDRAANTGPAAAALQEVADILGIPGPDDIASDIRDATEGRWGSGTQ